MPMDAALLLLIPVLMATPVTIPLSNTTRRRGPRISDKSHKSVVCHASRCTWFSKQSWRLHLEIFLDTQKQSNRRLWSGNGAAYMKTPLEQLFCMPNNNSFLATMHTRRNAVRNFLMFGFHTHAPFLFVAIFVVQN